MMINTSSVNIAITAAIKAVGEGYTYEDLRLNTVYLISAASYLVGCVEMMQGDENEDDGKPSRSYEEWRDIQRQFYEKEWNKK